ncbi:hypothetical protein SAMN05216522_102352 [Rosenbergiella nectarea]|uniref:Uncharacterized protein n=1 Tax=Rosenbergiella nectarea TaxID=988801 RepID=A0A1H9FKP8_9GAMM|nr:hypothetical protein [Rosenbergiella nectarea]SEQ38385.1 hypothetical protein SAMN05216522_102352 [Rosenbergiella nectarea]
MSRHCIHVHYQGRHTLVLTPNNTVGEGESLFTQQLESTLVQQYKSSAYRPTRDV